VDDGFALSLPRRFPDCVDDDRRALSEPEPPFDLLDDCRALPATRIQMVRFHQDLSDLTGDASASAEISSMGRARVTTTTFFFTFF
jgi:hypothetical protein